MKIYWQKKNKKLIFQNGFSTTTAIKNTTKNRLKFLTTMGISLTNSVKIKVDKMLFR